MKRYIDYIFLVLAVSVLLATPLWSATYYYDNTTGNNLDDGLSPENAWQTTAASRGGTAAGDTFLFNGGQEFTGRWVIIKNARVGSYGTGQAILKDGIYTSTDVVTTDGEIYNLEFSMSSAYYPVYLRGGSGWDIHDNTINCNHVGATQNGINTDVTENTILPSHDNSIYNNTISECNGAIFINKGSYNTYVYDNTVTTYGTNAKDGILTGDSTNNDNLAYNVFVYDNSIYCSGAGGIDIGEDNNSNGINIGYDSKNVYVYNNYITGKCGAGIQFDGSLLYDDYVYNNIIIGSAVGVSVWATNASGPSNNAHILNNTIISTSASSYGIWLRCGSSSYTGKCVREGTEIKNNIITGYDANASILVSVADDNDYLPDIDNNVFYNLGSSGTSFGKATIDTTSYTTLANWQAAVGGDTNSMVADAALGDDHLDASYKPESDFPGINKGLTFDSIFTTDYDGYTRAGLWDIGAYEFHQGGTPGNRVTLKRITIK